MTHTVHPYAHRLGIIRDWRSRWFGRRGQYQEFLRADVLLREFLQKRLRGLFVAGLEIERGQDSLRLLVRSSRPGMIIGRAGEGSTKLKNDIFRFMRRRRLPIARDFKLDIEEVKNPETEAAILAQMVVEGLERRLPFRRVLKQVADKAMAQSRVAGVRLEVAGRLGGAEIARTEWLKRGRLPLQTFRADIDFAREEALLSYGVIGVKAWVYRVEESGK